MQRKQKIIQSRNKRIIIKQNNKKLKQQQFADYVKEYNESNIDKFTEYIKTEYFNDGPKRQIMEEFLLQHNKTTNLIVFERKHPDIYEHISEPYAYSSVNINEYFKELYKNEKFRNNNEELIKSKDTHEQLCKMGYPLLFFIVQYPYKQNSEMCDLNYVVTKSLDLEQDNA